MKPIFQPASFGKKVEVVKFKTISKNVENNELTANNSIEKKKKKKKTQNKNSENVSQPIINKVAAGRVGKKTKSKINKQQIEAVAAEAQPQKSTTSEEVTQQKNVKQTKKEKKVKLLEKIKNGRIEKKKKKQAEQQQQQQESLKKVTLKPSLLRFAVKDVRQPTVSTSEIDSLADQLKQSLKGGRFRYINEQLYTMDSEAAQKLFAAEPDSFEAYHEGYRSQVEKWPLNPLDRIIKKIRRLPKTLVVGDFGCGEGRLAESVPNKVYSMDLVSTRADIIACDMAKTPLADQSLDIAVYCLSLMGTNLHDYLLEANRVLKDGGTVFIAEIQSRFEGDVRPFIRTLEAAGFHLVKREEGSNVFYFFQLKKTQYVGKVARLPPLALKPCMYKKR